MYMKRVSVNNGYTHSNEEYKMLISFDFYNTNIALNCMSHMDNILVHVHSNS